MATTTNISRWFHAVNTQTQLDAMFDETGLLPSSSSIVKEAQKEGGEEEQENQFFSQKEEEENFAVEIDLRLGMVAAARQEHEKEGGIALGGVPVLQHSEGDPISLSFAAFLNQFLFLERRRGRRNRIIQQNNKNPENSKEDSTTMTPENENNGNNSLLDQHHDELLLPAVLKLDMKHPNVVLPCVECLLQFYQCYVHRHEGRLPRWEIWLNMDVLTGSDINAARVPFFPSLSSSEKREEQSNNHQTRFVEQEVNETEKKQKDIHNPPCCQQGAKPDDDDDDDNSWHCCADMLNDIENLVRSSVINSHQDEVTTSTLSPSSVVVPPLSLLRFSYSLGWSTVTNVPYSQTDIQAMLTFISQSAKSSLSLCSHMMNLTEEKAEGGNGDHADGKKAEILSKVGEEEDNNKKKGNKKKSNNNSCAAVHPQLLRAPCLTFPVRTSLVCGHKDATELLQRLLLETTELLQNKNRVVVEKKEGRNVGKNEKQNLEYGDDASKENFPFPKIFLTFWRGREEKITPEDEEWIQHFFPGSAIDRD